VTTGKRRGRLFWDAENHCWPSAGRSAVVELNRLLTCINQRSATPDHIGTEHSFIFITSESTALGTRISHRANREIASRARLSALPPGTRLAFRSPLSFRPCRALRPLTSKKKNQNQNSRQTYQHFHAQTPISGAIVPRSLQIGQDSQWTLLGCSTPLADVVIL
jgi:hypothetical protein